MPFIRTLPHDRRVSISRLDAGKDHVLSWAPVPELGNMSDVNFKLCMTSIGTAGLHQRQMAAFYAFWIPLLDHEVEDKMPNTEAEIVKLVNKKIQKTISVAGTALDANWAAQRNTETNDDSTPETPGSDHKDPGPADGAHPYDENMIWRPDRMNERVFDRIWQPAKLYETKFMMGLHYGNALRTTDNGVKYFHNMEGTLGAGIKGAPNNGIIVFMLGLPPVPSATEFTEAHLSPADNKWETLTNYYSPLTNANGVILDDNVGDMSFESAYWRTRALWIRKKGDLSGDIETTSGGDAETSIETALPFTVTFDYGFAAMRQPRRIMESFDFGPR